MFTYACGCCKTKNQTIDERIRAYIALKTVNIKHKILTKDQIQIIDPDKPIGEGQFGQVFKGKLIQKKVDQKKSSRCNWCCITPGQNLTSNTCSQHESLIQSDSDKQSEMIRQNNLLDATSYMTHSTSNKSSKYGDNYLSVSSEPAIESVAIKVSTNINVNNYSFDIIKEFIDESLIGLEIHRHPNILVNKGIYFPAEEDKRRFDSLYSNAMILTPYMHNGDLLNFLRNCENNPESAYLSIGQAIEFAYDIAKGCQHLNKHDIMHRDIAARNCLIDEVFRIKISDFGLSRNADADTYYDLALKVEDDQRLASEKLPIYWLAVEVLRGDKYTVYADVWSFAVTVWEIFTRGKKPYVGVYKISPREVLDYLNDDFRLRQPKFMPDVLYDLLLRCWHENHTRRPSFDNIVVSLCSMLTFHDSFGLSSDQLNIRIDSAAVERSPEIRCRYIDDINSLKKIKASITNEDKSKNALPYKGAQYIVRHRITSFEDEISNTGLCKVTSDKLIKVSRNMAQQEMEDAFEELGDLVEDDAENSENEDQKVQQNQSVQECAYLYETKEKHKVKRNSSLQASFGWE